MAMDTLVSSVDRIGATAGVVWQSLSDNGPLTMAKLVKATDEPRDLVMQAVGWLAREGKLDVAEQGRNKVISLRQ
jgi:hypothetical protein